MQCLTFFAFYLSFHEQVIQMVMKSLDGQRPAHDLRSKMTTSARTKQGMQVRFNTTSSMAIPRTVTLLALIFLQIHTFVWSSEAMPKSVEELWANVDFRQAPLKTEIVKEWKENGGTFMLVRYSLGVLGGSNKTSEPMMAAYFGFPDGAKGSPGLLHLHGGGQRAEKKRVAYWVKQGYAAISINWGGLTIEGKDTPNTDWDGLAAGFVGDQDQKHHNVVSPGPNTLHKEVHPMNSSWMLIAMAARRALTFLESRPEVDKDRLGVEGHSMGGRSTIFTAIDPRLKAAAPSVGGSGYLYEDMWGLKGSARHMREDRETYKKLVGAHAYWPHITCPTLFLGASNDFNSPTELVVKAMNGLPPSTDRRLIMAPHFNHRFSTSATMSRLLWMEAHLKKEFIFPQTSRSELILNTEDGIPLFKVWPQKSEGKMIQSINVYYGYARDPRIRFWRDGQAQKIGDHYVAKCPVFDNQEPLFVFADIIYDAGKTYHMPPGHLPSRHFSVSTAYHQALPQQLQAAKVKSTFQRERLIDDFSRGWHDWYRLSYDNAQHWLFATRKLVDPSHMGPKGAQFSVSVKTTQPHNRMAIIAEVNSWQNYTGRRRGAYTAMVNLPKAGENNVPLNPSDFKDNKGEGMKDWDEITQLIFRPSVRVMDSKGAAAEQDWKGDVPELLKLQWLGGDDTPRLHPHQQRDAVVRHGRESFEQEFQKAISDSVELEERDAKEAEQK